MTIKVAKALPRYRMKAYVDFKLGNVSNEFIPTEIKELNELVRKFHDVYVVSMSDYHVESLNLACFNEENKLLLNFDDMDPIKHPNLVNTFKETWRLFQDQQAEDVIEFLYNAHTSTTKDCLLLVNCHMGISRSGAVVTVVKDKCNIPEQTHNKYNEWIRPNQYMIKKLHDANLKLNRFK